MESQVPTRGPGISLVVETRIVRRGRQEIPGTTVPFLAYPIYICTIWKTITWVPFGTVVGGWTPLGSPLFGGEAFGIDRLLRDLLDQKPSPISAPLENTAPTPGAIWRYPVSAIVRPCLCPARPWARRSGAAHLVVSARAPCVLPALHLGRGGSRRGGQIGRPRGRRSRRARARARLSTRRGEQERRAPDDADESPCSVSSHQTGNG